MSRRIKKEERNRRRRDQKKNEDDKRKETKDQKKARNKEDRHGDKIGKVKKQITEALRNITGNTKAVTSNQWDEYMEGVGKSFKYMSAP